MVKNFDTNKLIVTSRKKLNENNIDSLVRKIHENAADEEKNELFVRTSLDIPKNLFKRIKIRVIEKDSTFKNYIIDLVEKDLNKQQLMLNIKT